MGGSPGLQTRPSKPKSVFEKYYCHFVGARYYRALTVWVMAENS